MSRVLVIGDTHCPVMHRRYVTFLQEIAELWKIDEVVHIGDLVDWASISYHPKAPSLRNSQQEYVKAKKQVTQLYEAFPEATWIIGNHDALTERQLFDIGLPIEVLKDYREMWGVLNWEIIPRFGHHLIDDVLYMHGDKGRYGKFPAIMNAEAEFQSVVQGHAHSSAGVMYGANSNLRYFGMQVGCGVDYRSAAMSYGHKYAKKPILGCGVVIDGTTALFEPMNLGNKYGILK
ncbi:MAG: metallophosphoesterase [Planctomycetaceae bacterium]|nr:metallophosphoesterase [Planctomycetaceae bacterium]